MFLWRNYLDFTQQCNSRIRADPFLWCNSIENRYTYIAVLAKDILSTQASSVASEDVFSEAGTLDMAVGYRTSLSPPAC